MGSTITRLVALFAVISVAGIAFVAFRYVGASELVGLVITALKQFLHILYQKYD